MGGGPCTTYSNFHLKSQLAAIASHKSVGGGGGALIYDLLVDNYFFNNILAITISQGFQVVPDNELHIIIKTVYRMYLSIIKKN